MTLLQDRVALVTGASRGVGKGIAVGLGEAGATVVVTGRTSRVGAKSTAGSVEETAEAVTTAGGRGIPIVCDHRDDGQVVALFERIAQNAGPVDILVNNAWGGYEAMFDENGVYTWERPCWEQPMARWDAMFQAGVRAAYVASRLAAPGMIARRHGMIVNVSFWAAQKRMGNVAYGMSKAATDKMTHDMAIELAPYGVVALSLYPGLVRTESVMAAAACFDLSNSESPQFVGRAVAALAADPEVTVKSGQILVTAALAQEYGFTDLDGFVPVPATLETA